MNILKELATNKIMTINHNASIKEAMKVMYENKNGCVILVENSYPKGIITESDIVNGFKNSVNINDKAIVLAKKKLLTTDENRPIEFAFDMLSQYNIRRIILLNKKKEYSGVVLQEDLFDYLEEDVYKIDLKISDIIDRSKGVFTVTIDDTVQTVMNKMQELKIGSLVVTHDENSVGIITEKDILRLKYNEVNTTTKVSLHMSSPVVTLIEDTFVTDAIEMMKIKNIRRVVIVNSNKELVSILTNRDILKNVKGNYTRTLQNKIKHAQEIMNFLPEPIIEIYYLDEEDMIHWVNTQAKNIFGEDIIDKSIVDIINKEDWEYIKKTLIESKILKDINLKIDNQVFEVSGSLMKNSGTNYIKLLFKDVTGHAIEKAMLQKIIDDEMNKRIDSQYLLMQQSKLATMGEMIGHIAHQWRQPLGQLGGIFMNIESAYGFGELDEKYLGEKIDHCNELITYMSNTIEDFRHFFTPTKDKEYFNICDYIKNAINLILASLTYHHISIKFENCKGSFEVLGYPSEFSQVILNLLSNAQDALTTNKVSSPYIHINLREDSKKIFIDIEDNGGGIDPKIIDEIFNIYFTTKSKKEGTGLGLYMSKLIIETKFGGRIYTTNHHSGSIFTIELSKSI